MEPWWRLTCSWSQGGDSTSGPPKLVLAFFLDDGLSLKCHCCRIVLKVNPLARSGSAVKDLANLTNAGQVIGRPSTSQKSRRMVKYERANDQIAIGVIHFRAIAGNLTGSHGNGADFFAGHRSATHQDNVFVRNGCIY